MRTHSYLLLVCGVVAFSCSDESLDPSFAADGKADVATAVHGTVTVTLYRSLEPWPDAAVMYQDVDGSYVGTVTTDSQGNATIEEMPVGGFVTAATDFLPRAVVNEDDTVLTTVADVQDGDHIVFGQPFEPSPANAAESALVLSVSPPAVGGTHYEIVAGCNVSSSAFGGSTVAVNLWNGCRNSNGLVDVVAYVADGTSPGDRVAYSTASDVASAAAMTPWKSDLGTYSVSLSNAPTLAPSGDGVAVGATVLGVRDGVVLGRESLFQPLPAGPDGSPTAFRLANDFFDGVEIVARQEWGDEHVPNYNLVVLRDSAPSPDAPADLAIDATADLFPLLGAEVQESPLGFSFSADRAPTCLGGLTAGSIVSIVTHWVPQQQSSYSWQLIHRGDRAESGVVFPDLDPDLIDELWPEQVQTAGDPVIWMFGKSGVEWADWRQNFASSYAAEASITCEQHSW